VEELEAGKVVIEEYAVPAKRSFPELRGFHRIAG
jgi:hypothetical protein